MYRCVDISVDQANVSSRKKCMSKAIASHAALFDVAFSAETKRIRTRRREHESPLRRRWWALFLSFLKGRKRLDERISSTKTKRCLTFCAGTSYEIIFWICFGFVAFRWDGKQTTQVANLLAGSVQHFIGSSFRVGHFHWISIQNWLAF